MSKYCIIGTGKQGTAALYDLLLFSDAKTILLIDSCKDSFKRLLDIINPSLFKKTKIIFEVVDIHDTSKLRELLKPIDVMLSSVPYQFNLILTEIAIDSQTSMVDLGGHTQNVITQLSFNEKAIEKN